MVIATLFKYLRDIFKSIEYFSEHNSVVRPIASPAVEGEGGKPGGTRLKEAIGYKQLEISM
jgi:hypothetical protein